MIFRGKFNKKKHENPEQEKKSKEKKMVSDHVVKLCNQEHTLSSLLAQDTSRQPKDILQELYGQFKRDRTCKVSERRQPESQEARDTALKCGKWGPTSPSPLFLQAFADSINCLEADPLSGLVSPPLMGSYGTMPLTVIAPLVDVIRHCSNLIARAEKDVFFITCVWSPSIAQRLICEALKELSNRSLANNRRVSVHIMYDAAGIANLKDSHQSVKPHTYTSKSIGLPTQEEIPNVDLKVMNLHTIPLGTLHAKFCVVDNKMAAVMSNNMQDNDNMEMMVHLEGPIVESIRDTAIMTWLRELNNSIDLTAKPSSKNGDNNLYLDQSPGATIQAVASTGTANPHLSEHVPGNPQFDPDIAAEILRIQSTYARKPNETHLQAANRQLNLPLNKPISPTGPEISDGDEMTPYLSTTTLEPIPIAMVSRPPYGCVGSGNAFVPQNEAWLSLIRNAKQGIFIQTPDLNAEPLLPELINALRRGIEVTIYVCFGYNDLGEMIPGQGGTNDQVSKSLVESLPDNGPEKELLRIYNYVGKDQDHPIHQLFKSRSCHIKLLIVDGSVGIQGSGNQDTQSWFHSQEVNVMVDSKEICSKWRLCIDRNQNTAKFGRVAQDGIWRDAEGNPGKGYMGDPGKITGLVKGVFGMVMKMKGLGGF